MCHKKNFSWQCVPQKFQIFINFQKCLKTTVLINVQTKKRLRTTEFICESTCISRWLWISYFLQSFFFFVCFSFRYEAYVHFVTQNWLLLAKVPRFLITIHFIFSYSSAWYIRWENVDTCGWRLWYSTGMYITWWRELRGKFKTTFLVLV